MSMIGRIGALALAFALAACASFDIEEHAGTAPELDLAAYFDGRVYAWGVFLSRSGELRRSFRVVIDGDWDGRTLTLDERFLFDDGETDRRVWRLARLEDGRWTGEADDTVTPAQGAAVGAAFAMTYKTRLDVGETSHVVAFDDRMFRVDEDTVINEAIVRKFNIRVGEAKIVFRRAATDDPAPFPLDAFNLD